MSGSPKRWQLINFLNIGKLDRQEFGKLVGVARINHDLGRASGKKRRTKGGRSGVHRDFYSATLVATRYNPAIERIYQHLLA